MSQAWNQRKEPLYEHMTEGRLARGDSHALPEEIVARTVDKGGVRASQAAHLSTCTDDISSEHHDGLGSGRGADKGATRARRRPVKAGSLRICRSEGGTTESVGLAGCHGL